MANAIGSTMLPIDVTAEIEGTGESERQQDRGVPAGSA